MNKDISLYKYISCAIKKKRRLLQAVLQVGSSKGSMDLFILLVLHDTRGSFCVHKVYLQLRPCAETDCVLPLSANGVRGQLAAAPRTALVSRQPLLFLYNYLYIFFIYNQGEMVNQPVTRIGWFTMLADTQRPRSLSSCVLRL